MRGEWRAESAVVVALEGLLVVVMVRGCEGEVCWAWCWCVCEGEEEMVDVEEAFPCCSAEWARKAARKLAKKGRCVGIVLFICVSSLLSRCVGEEEEKVRCRIR